MPLQDDLESTVNSLFGAYSASTLAIPSNKGNLYELYLYLLLCTHISHISGRLRFVNPTGIFRFRCSPGPINIRDFSYAEFMKNSDVYELRNGIEIEGFNMHHELDIIIFKGTQPNNLKPCHINTTIIWAIECKNHKEISSLKGESRKFLGAVTDLSASAHSSAGCMHCGHSFEPFFATPVNATINNKTRIFLNSYGLNPEFDLRPYTRVEGNFIRKVVDMYVTL